MQHSALVPTVTLMSLSLSDCSISDDGVKALANSLWGCFYNDNNRSKNTTTRFGGLEKLVLSENDISDVGSIYLADALKQNNILTHLDLVYNDIGLAGGSAICEALELYNNTLTHIGIEGNPCYDLIYKNTKWTIGHLCEVYSTESGEQYSDPNLQQQEDPNLQQQEEEQPKQVDATEKQKYYQQIKAQKVFEFLSMKLG